MTVKQRAAWERRVREAMAGLCGHPEFRVFIDLLREYRETAIEDACSDRVLANQRASMAAIGEVRAYKSIISFYEEHVAQAAERAEQTGTAED